jgi:hypothetical protein
MSDIFYLNSNYIVENKIWVIEIWDIKEKCEKQNGKEHGNLRYYSLCGFIFAPSPINQVSKIKEH